ncbi:curli-like amyloid fiber formation chaperone CsgH [Sphingosinicella sp. LHD-64]|uniref:curli-like amyloid fiber formation chaperone CsgH n=1 Tax=Sphingosinicella sp. LHD-64 TaxID=3072139 RepID=UPI00281062A3|nr:curli-like amyloid fiber formation chaperone CsgH [Sphingosinicella sp. LHD-64]MDQ8757802.1 curli-like amyloid fiber formation chaperone CsgH [Sphingosinicella sp. LHD-64]
MLSFFSAALALMTAGPGTSQPIQLVVEPRGDGVQLRVVGDSDHAVEATYTLEVASDAAAGGNRTTQRGRANLQPGTPAALMTLTLGNAARGRWTARLRVEPVGAAAYEEVRSGPDE